MHNIKKSKIITVLYGYSEHGHNDTFVFPKQTLLYIVDIDIRKYAYNEKNFVWSPELHYFLLCTESSEPNPVLGENIQT